MASKNRIQVILNKIAEGNCEEVDLRFTDILGYWRHVTVPARNITEIIFKKGIGFDGSSLEGMTETEKADLILLPDVRRIFEDPFTDRPTLSLLCDIVDPQTGKPFSRDPRGVVRRANDYLKDSGIATETLWSPEFEFYLFDKTSFWHSQGQSGYRIESIESPGSSENEESKGLVHTSSTGYHMMFPVDSLHNIRSEIVSWMIKAGIQVKYHHHEAGRMGQVEVEVQFSPLLSTSDNVMLTKHIIRNVALKNNLSSTFMPKPLAGEPGSGMHFHICFRKNGENIFYSNKGYCKLSGTALYAIAGILLHAPALCAFTNASVNSYHRLVPNQEAPVYRFFSGSNRSAAIRIPVYADSDDSKRFEYRVPDATGNPYLSMSAILMAASDGIKRQLDPKELGFGPIDKNVFSEGFDTSALAQLPENFTEALNALKADRAFLEQGEVFTPDLIDSYINVKKEECARFFGNPHPLEYKMYFNL